MCSGLVPLPHHSCYRASGSDSHANCNEPTNGLIVDYLRNYSCNEWHALPFLKETLGRTLFRNWDRESRLFRVDRAIRRLRRNSKELKSSRKVIWITFAEAKLVYSLVLSRAFLSLEETTDTLGKKMQVSLHRLSKDRHELYYYF